MEEFHAPAAADRQWFTDCMFHAGFRGCEYSFTNAFLWNEVYRHDIARVGDMACLRLTDAKGMRYLYPAGRGDVFEALSFARADAEARGIPFRVIGLTEETRAALERQFPGQFQFEENRWIFDYIYRLDRLADLPGKQLHAKRNHIRRFEESHPDWRFETLTGDNLSACREMSDQWYAENASPGDSVLDERRVLLRGLECFRELGLEGGLIRAGGRVLAFAVGDRMNGDTYGVHFEKAFGEIQGAYAVINREFARWIRAHHAGVTYVNRENDMDLEGLRKAKLSYHPDILLKKYTATASSP